MDKGRRDRERRNHLLQIKANPAHPLSLSLFCYKSIEITTGLLINIPLEKEKETSTFFIHLAWGGGIDETFVGYLPLHCRLRHWMLSKNDVVVLKDVEDKKD